MQLAQELVGVRCARAHVQLTGHQDLESLKPRKIDADGCYRVGVKMQK